MGTTTILPKTTKNPMGIRLAKILCLIASILLLAAAIGSKILLADPKLLTVQVEIVGQDEEHTSWWTILYLRGTFYPIAWGNRSHKK